MVRMDCVSVFMLLGTVLHVEMDLQWCSSGFGLFLTITFTKICWLLLPAFCKL